MGPLFSNLCVWKVWRRKIKCQTLRSGLDIRKLDDCYHFMFYLITSGESYVRPALTHNLVVVPKFPKNHKNEPNALKICQTIFRYQNRPLNLKGDRSPISLYTTMGKAHRKANTQKTGDKFVLTKLFWSPSLMRKHSSHYHSYHTKLANYRVF